MTELSPFLKFIFRFEWFGNIFTACSRITVCSVELKRGDSFSTSLNAKHTVINITSTLSMSHALGRL